MINGTKLKKFCSKIKESPGDGATDAATEKYSARNKYSTGKKYGITTGFGTNVYILYKKEGILFIVSLSFLKTPINLNFKY